MIIKGSHNDRCYKLVTGDIRRCLQVLIVRSHDAPFTIVIGGYKYVMSLQPSTMRSHDGNSSELVDSYIEISFTIEAS